MSIIADMVMFAWPMVVLALFVLLPPRRAVLVGYIGGWQFLPLTSYQLPLFPDFTKMSATTCAVLLGTIVFDAQRIAKFRFRWFDMPAVVYCVSPFFSSATNGLGTYEGMSGIADHVIAWGLPYFLGRLYFSDSLAIRDLAIAIFIGGLIYIPFCLFEIRMSPQLATMVYGSPGRWYNAIRFGGYRPRVFMVDGLMLGMWMTITSLVGFWLWWTNALKQIRGLPVFGLAPLLIIVTIMCRSAGALALLMAGVSVLLFSRYSHTRLAVCFLLLIAPMYIVTRTTGVWDGRHVSEWAGEVDEDRAGSFQFRIENEEMLIDKALQRPVFGWGSWGRNHVFDDWGKDISITDGRWIIEFGKYGLVGLVSLYALLLLPTSLLVAKVPARRLLSTDFAPEMALAVVIVLYAIDCLPNAMTNPVLMLVAGAVASRAIAKTEVELPSVNRITLSGQCDAPLHGQNIARRKLNSGRLEQHRAEF